MDELNDWKLYTEPECPHRYHMGLLSKILTAYLSKKGDLHLTERSVLFVLLQAK
jgi:hypothetical protein